MATGQEESSVSTPWTSSPSPLTSAISSPSSRVIPAAQHGASRILRREVRALRPANKRVVLFEPSADAAAVMGLDVMDVSRAGPTVEAAREAAMKSLRARKLRQLAEQLF